MAEFDTLTGLGYGIITFAIVIGVGLIVLSKFGTAVAECPANYTYNSNGTTTFTTNTCCLNDGGYTNNSACTGAGGGPPNTTGAGEGTDTTIYMIGQVGEDGLASWTPAIIALVVGMLFLGMFLSKDRRV